MNWPNVPEDHPTPSLVVSASIVEANLHRMQEYCDRNKLRLRPHTKTHKSLEMARRQVSCGAKGLTVAKAGEAEIMSQVSNDIFVAYPAIGPDRVKRLVQTAKRAQVTVAADSVSAIDILQKAAQAAGLRFGIIVDIDVGFHRTGVEKVEEAIELCLHACRMSHLDFRGLMCFPGHLLPNASESQWNQYAECLGRLVETLEKKGIPVETISGGSTPTAMNSHRNPWVNEIRPGTYIYNDANEVALGVATWEQCAARVLATVVSVPSRCKFVVDAGSKTLSSDRNCVDADSGFGYVVEFPDAKITRLSEEHGEIVLPDTFEGRLPIVGDRVWIIPNHICVCVNLQNQFYLLDSNHKLIALPVDARGRLV